jgi:hypothetical protein
VSSCSYLACQSEFRDAFLYSPVPNKWTLSRLVNHFHDTGSMQDRNYSSQPSVLSDNSLDDVHQSLLCSQGKSLRKLCLENGFSCGSAHKATKILKLHPYCVHVMHELKEPVKEKQILHCRWFTHFIWGCIDISIFGGFEGELKFTVALQKGIRFGWGERLEQFYPAVTCHCVFNVKPLYESLAWQLQCPLHYISWKFLEWRY